MPAQEVWLSAHPCSLCPLWEQCWPGIVLRFKNKGILAWAPLAEGRRGRPCPRPEGHLAGKGGLAQLYHQHSWERGGSPENHWHLDFCHETHRWRASGCRLPSPRAGSSRLPLTLTGSFQQTGVTGGTQAPLLPSLPPIMLMIIAKSQQPWWGSYCCYYH